ncbi:MAG: phosphonoacetaldehyde reductase [Lentisphaeria bacterium]|nr:phosphonoacetaldehyde reductase [Lentisphaeria bacterium]
MTQTIITAENNYTGLDAWIERTGAKTILLVCDESIRFLKDISAHFELIESRGTKLVGFSDFQPNPLYESVVAGVQAFLRNDCSAIIALGGGSAMDVAKCIKLFSNMDHGRNYLEQAIVPNKIPFLAVPTTAGTGSEATRYAVIYYNDAKQSVTSESIIPEAVLLDPGVLKTLPAYQKKSTMMDAFCHALESFWSVNSTEESRRFSRTAIELVLQNMDGYLANSEDGNAGMLLAANTAGKAINITQTTAGHAMCYKITSLFGCAHGHAAALCDRVLFPWMLENTHLCIDPRGEGFLKNTFRQIANAMGCNTPEEAADKLNVIFTELELEIPSATEEQFAILKSSVNPVRLKNHPIKLDTETIDTLYRKIINS